MSRLLAYAVVGFLVAATPLSASAVVQIAGSSNTELCGPDAPEGYKRPGGFCEQLDDWKSLAPVPGDCTAGFADAAFDKAGRILIAGEVDPCCYYTVSLDPQELPAEGVLVAVYCGGPPP